VSATKEFYDFGGAKRGAVIGESNKTRITMYVDTGIPDAVRDAAAKQGKGYQTLINEALSKSMRSDGEPLTVESLPRVIREEVKAD
jgi:uncharacterized protein (DUF4415 family)